VSDTGPERDCPGRAGQPSPLRILHRDEHLVAVDKPCGLLVHRTVLARGEREAAVQLLRDQLGCWVHPVHRLDRATSGALVFALDREVAAVMSLAFAHGRVEKDYLAVVRGVPPARGCIDHPLREDGSPLARPARTGYRRLARVEVPVRVDRYPTSRYAIVAVRPVTGRRHQIRRHLRHIAHPVLGDTMYGKARHNHCFAEMVGCTRLWLHCASLSFTHPVHRTALRIGAAPGEAFERLARALPWHFDVESLVTDVHAH
jgi:tRNA pseudouridine65 synthase